MIADRHMMPAHRLELQQTTRHLWPFRRIVAVKTLLCVCGLVLAFEGSLAASSYSSRAYRALGQSDLRQNGVNGVSGAELFSPNGVALDTRGGEVHLYVADTNNHRVLGWRDIRSYRAGDPAELALAQPSAEHSGPLGIGPQGLTLPLGLAVDPISGDLYVADLGNHRVLRFPEPFERRQVEPDAVYGQPSFASGVPNAGGVDARSLNGPRALAFDPLGNLWVADTGNHRLLRFPRASLESENPAADVVIGQADFTERSPNPEGVGAAGFDTPAGLAFDHAGNLYVVDFRNARVLVFPAPQSTNQAASIVLGQPSFDARGFAGGTSASTLAGPVGLAVDSAARLYVAVSNDNRILAFPPGALFNAPAVLVLGQTDFHSTSANAGIAPLASAETLSNPTALALGPDGALFVADSGNHRVLSFPAESKAASRVWGQPDLTSNAVNRVEPGRFNAPYQAVVDYSREPFPLYLSDTNNHRILIWEDAARFFTGEDPTRVIGQPGLRSAHANLAPDGGEEPSAATVSSPKGLAVDQEGNLWVADSANHRVLRYPRPLDQTAPLSADVVLGQLDFASVASAAVSAGSLRQPSSVSIGPAGNLYVSDTGNHRVLRYKADPLSGERAEAVFGQTSFHSSTEPAEPTAQTLRSPEGVFVDAAGLLYVADAGANRVLLYPAAAEALGAGASAAIVLGQPDFISDGAGAGASGLRQPIGVAVDTLGQVLVSDSGNSRVVVHAPAVLLPFAGAEATAVVGQPNLTGSRANWNSPDGLATAEGLFTAAGLHVDRNDTLYVADRGNHRLVHFLKPAVSVNASHFRADIPVAPGALVTVFGEGFSGPSEAAQTLPLPRALAGRTVEINDTLRAPLLFVGPAQINLQLPWQTPIGSQRIAVRRADSGELLAGDTLLTAAASPGLFLLGLEDSVQGVVLNQDGRTNTPQQPAGRGTFVTLFGTGQGEVSPAVSDGEPAPATSLAHTIAAPTADGGTCLSEPRAVCVAVGSTFGEVQFSGLAPGLSGVWQINVRIPDDALTGTAVPLRAVIAGRPSNIVTMAIE